MIARKVTYSGRVQGVGFRYTAKRIASGFDIVGSVRNLADGRVEMLAMADDAEELSEFLEAIEISDLGSLIKESTVETIAPPAGLRGFVIEA